MLLDLPFDPLAAGAHAHRVSAIPRLREGEWNTLLDVDGPGMITHLWFTFPPEDKTLGRRNLLRIFWDNETEPSVVAPLTDFFGIPFGFSGAEYQMSSRFLVVAPRNGFNSYFKMPFASHARIEIFPEQIESGGGFYFQADYYEFPEQLPEPYRLLRFHAQFRFENPCENYGRNYLFADAEGKGLFLGATFGIEVNHPQPDAWFHGGGDTFLIDGEIRPHVLHGIGAEDFFGHSWGVRTFQSPAIGTPWHETDEDGKVKRIALYRFFIDDPIPFRSSIRATLGALANNYSSVAYWLQEEPHRPFFDVPEADKRMPRSNAPYGIYDIEPAEAIEWRLLAPFQIDDAHPFDSIRPFEVEETGSEVYAYKADGKPALPGGNEMEVAWRTQRAYHGFVDYNRVARPAVTCIRLQTGVLGYALTYLESEEERDVIVHVGFDDEIGIRVNADVVYTGSHRNGFHEVACPARLHAGSNRILVKLSNQDNDNWRFWGFSFRVEDA